MASRLKQINRGTTYTNQFTYQKNGVATSLVGATVYFTVKSNEFDIDTTDSSAIIIKDVTTHTDAVNGITVIELTPTQTAYKQGTTTFIVPGDYFFDVKVKESNGKIYKAAEGTVSIDGSPTNRGI